MNLGIYVGSFNPVHNGHINIVEYLTKKNIVDQILIIPTGNYWDKNNLIDIKHRINMLKLYETDKIKIDTTHNHIEYTYQLLNKLKEENPNDIIHLIIGADNIVSLDKWKNIENILEYQIIVFGRDNINIKEHINKFNNTKNFKIINDLKETKVSSTEIRKSIKNKQIAKLNDMLDRRVIEYILKNNLYK